MANIDKDTVRGEVEKVKEQFDVLCDTGSVSKEIKALMGSMLLIMELILSIFLERQTRKNSKNSSIPPSQTEKDDSSLDPSTSHGKGKRENSNRSANNTRTIEIINTSNVDACGACGTDLHDQEPTGVERRTIIDIVFEKQITHIDAEIKSCPKCHAISKGEFPNHMHGPLQYGNGLKAYMINLAVCQMVALHRVQKLVNSMINQLISEASILKFILRLHQALEGWEKSAIEQLLQSKAINVDETSFRVDKKNHWIHVYSAGQITLKRLHEKRGLAATEEINIIPRYGGVIIHDCWASYLSYKHCGHGLCGSHLLRELTFVIQVHDYPWAKNMKRLLKETCHKVSISADKKIDSKAYANLQKRYRNIITRGEKQLPIIPPKPSGKRGKLAKSDAHNLLERFKKHETAVLLFANDPYVSFTNNRAEQDLRMAKVKQKVSGCFRSLVYAQAYCRISSYIQTMANKGYNPLVAIQMALVGKSDGG